MEDLKEELEKHGYSIIKPIGHGSSALCYIVKSMKYSNNFVCKLLHKKAQMYDCYEQEIAKLLQLNHPNIVRMYEYFNLEKFYCIILEYCPGGSLMDRIDNEGTFQMQEIAMYGEQLLLAIQYLHSFYIAHHDIKPANLLIDKFNRLNLADFGIAKKYSFGQLSDDIRGTPAFVAPEIIKKLSYDPFKADIYSFGVTIYTLAVGKPPFYSKSKENMIKLVSSGDYYIPSNIPIKLKECIRSCMSMNPNDRPSIEILISSWRKNFKNLLNKNANRFPELDLFRHRVKLAKEHKNAQSIPSHFYKNRTKPTFVIPAFR